MEDYKKIRQKITFKNIPFAPHYNTLSNLNFTRIHKKQNIIKKRNTYLKSIKTENNYFIRPPNKKIL